MNADNLVINILAMLSTKDTNHSNLFGYTKLHKKN